jgi:hypothetical protein
VGWLEVDFIDVIASARRHEVPFQLAWPVISMNAAAYLP